MIEIEYTKKGLPVPIVNGIYLHSNLDPIKEAKTFVDAHLNKINSSEKLLILGLGFGYHIKEINDYLDNNKLKKEILILEPNKDLIKKFHCYSDIKNINILGTNDVDLLFLDEEFTNFLLEKPSILIHINSFNINKKFYTFFLNYHSDKTIKSISTLLPTKYQRDFFNSSASNFKEHIEQIDNKDHLFTKNDYLYLALNELIGNI